MTLEQLLAGCWIGFLCSLLVCLSVGALCLTVALLKTLWDFLRS